MALSFEWLNDSCAWAWDNMMIAHPPYPVIVGVPYVFTLADSQVFEDCDHLHFKSASQMEILPTSSNVTKTALSYLSISLLQSR